MTFIKYIQDDKHYTEVLKRAEKVKNNLWIGTADIKDLYIKHGTLSVPFLGLLSNKISSGVDIRLIHAKEPGENFRTDFDKYPNLWGGMERVLCPRVHFKIILFDLKEAYIGSANLTGAGLGMKSGTTRNFEAGILTDDPQLVEEATNHFDTIWMGKACKSCRRKPYCKDRII